MRNWVSTQGNQGARKGNQGKQVAVGCWMVMDGCGWLQMGEDGCTWVRVVAEDRGYGCIADDYTLLRTVANGALVSP